MKLLLLIAALSTAATAQDAFEVKVTGHGQANGQTMILIPGLSSAGETWDTTVAHYQDRFECHVLTLAGFAGVPRIPAPMLEHVRDAVAEYIRENKIAKPVIVGHSLGGFLALAIAARYPDLAGKLVIVDAYPFLSAVYDPKITTAEAKANAATTRQYMTQTQDMYERYVKSGVATRMMVTSDADLDRIIGWGLASDRTAVTDAMVEMLTTDLRDEVARIQVPTLVLGTWAGMKEYTDRAKTEANFKAQYAKLAGARIQMNDTARHFVMWDDPQWMFSQIDRFLGRSPSELGAK
ncbi:MAG TPA: alpha/beta hydrolase [Candidatus Binataceae bacterium]